MTNFQPSERSKTATLGPRKNYAQMINKLFASVTNVVKIDANADVEEEEVRRTSACLPSCSHYCSINTMLPVQL
jgi:hypothetical protein